MRLPRLLAAVLLFTAATAQAAVLPEDRADLMYHRYSGGGITVDGPSVLVRKGFGDSVSATASYYVDNISSASIDVVVSGASRYAERREQKSVGVDYLRGKSTYSASYLTSKENDYKANTWTVGVSQDMFGDLTTVSLGYSQGRDKIGSSVDPDFADEIERRNYRAGLTQVLTRSMLLSLNFEAVTEQGYLQNPYRFMRYVNQTGSYTRAPEVFPRTRTGTAGSARLKYFLPWRAALEGQYRFYTDTWGINAHTAGVEYTQPLKDRWIFTGSYRYYRQNSANFFSDLFPYPDAQNFMARDKETSALQSQTVGLGVAYQLPLAWAPWLKRGTANLRINHLMVDYSKFRDLRQFPPGTAEPGTEPLYSLDANVLQFFLSLWF
ncbi:MAG: DUF3570 domain-containing protein [Steroidobacteraceae bacterium]